MKRPVAFLVISTLLVWMGTVCAQIITGSISFSQIAGTLSLTTQVTGQLAPTNGGVGAMTGAPMWTRYLGTGADSTGPASGSLTGSTQHVFQYTSWHCTGAITYSGAQGILVLVQGTANFDTGCSVTGATGNNAASGDFGGAGGSGGSGSSGLNSAASTATRTYSAAQGYLVSALAAASSNSVGADGGAISANVQKSMLFNGLWLSGNFTAGGSPGTAGGNTGGTGGNGGLELIVIAHDIIVANGVTFTTSGFPGAAPAAINKGGGGGGGGAVMAFFSETFTDNGGIYNYNGGPGGACTAPNIQVGSGGCDTTGCGTDAVITVSALTGGGGLQPTGSGTTITNGGSGYKTAPPCVVNANGSGITGAACHFTISGGAINTFTVDTAGSGGTFTSEATCFVGGYGANGFFVQKLIQ